MSVTKQVSSKLLLRSLKKHLESAKAINDQLIADHEVGLMEETYFSLHGIKGSLNHATNYLKDGFKSEGMPFKQKLQSV